MFLRSDRLFLNEECMIKGKKRVLTWKNYHKYVGVISAVFMLFFCVSGIILNHRKLFADCQISRAWLPGSYHFQNYNNGILKGTMALDDSLVLAYGCAGIWLTNKDFSDFKDFNAGLPRGVDGRNIKNVVKTGEGTLWCAALYNLYRHDGSGWVKQDLPDNEERLSDVALDKKGRQVLALTRSSVYTVSSLNLNDSTVYKVERHQLQSPENYTPKVTLFKTVWLLHSGELFGIVGKLAVDFVAAVMAVLCLTGMLLFVFPYVMRRHKRLMKGKIRKWEGTAMKWSQRWHNRLGYYLLALSLLVVVTGMCLRPPLMIPLVLTKSSPLPGTVQDQENVWSDKLRAIRWDKAENAWLISTSDGFIRVDEQFRLPPVLLPSEKSPAVSPMGITVFKQENDGEWLVGSFSGMYRWSPASGDVADYFSGRPVEKRKARPVAANMVSGYTDDVGTGKLITFDYVKGATGLPIMPQLLKEQPMSLWNFALELHVGRCYSPFLGPFSELFVFLSGLLITLVLLSGYIVYSRRKKKRGNIEICINNNQFKT